MKVKGQVDREEMRPMGQTFDKTFKQEAVHLAQTSGKSQRQVVADPASLTFQFQKSSKPGQQQE
jgi:hypothetical protein